MKLRVCHLGKFYPPAPGGVETHVQTLARAQSLAGASVQVICVNHRDSAGTDVTWQPLGATPTVVEMDGDVRVTRLGRRASVSRLDMCPSLLGALWKLRDDGVDVVHVHAPNPTMFLALAALPEFSTLVVTHHSDVVKQRVLGRLFSTVERRVHDRAALVLSTSEAYVKGSSVLQMLHAKVQALPLGLDLSEFSNPSERALEWQAKLCSELGNPLWLSVGRLVYYKGLTTAIDALVHVPGRLLVIGIGPMESELRARAAKRGVADRIVWTGQVDRDKLIGAYRAATALWFPSNARSEGFGLVQVEAMASGSPVINAAVSHSGVASVSRDGETGFTVPLNDARALAEASQRLLREPGLRERLGASAIARAHGEFDHVLMARRSLEMYERALAKPNLRRKSSLSRTENGLSVEPAAQ